MNSRTQQTYVGIHNDLHGGMTPIGGIIKDAWVFEFIPESETCEGWATAQIQVLHDKVNAAWDQYGLRVSNLPPEIRERHTRIHDQAIEKARSMGWVPGRDSDAEME